MDYLENKKIVMERSLKSRVYLRALDLSDLDRVFAWHNDKYLYDYLGGNFRWISLNAEEEWLRHRIAYSTSEVNLAICLLETDEHIGNIYLRGIDWIAHHAELHIFIGKKNVRGIGYGGEALQLILDHAFGDLGLHRVYLYVLASNQTALQLYKKCGFIEEGRLRHHAFKKNRFEDMLVMGIINSEWKGEYSQ